jgi:two-component sensor histidine kinase
MTDRNDFLRELHHRVRNNFQIIASMMNLQKRMLPPERRGDFRFIEEHIQSMAVAYRILSTRSEMVEISIPGLIRETTDNLRQIAGARGDVLHYEIDPDCREIDLNQGILLGLYIAVVLPPYLDHAAIHGGTVTIGAGMSGDRLTISVRGAADVQVANDVMRRRLIDAYMRQLRGETPAAEPPGERALTFALDPPRAPFTAG